MRAERDFTERFQLELERFGIVAYDSLDDPETLVIPLALGRESVAELGHDHGDRRRALDRIEIAAYKARRALGMAEPQPERHPHDG